jgi:hypothetical protein
MPDMRVGAGGKVKSFVCVRARMVMGRSRRKRKGNRGSMVEEVAVGCGDDYLG